MAAAVRGAPIRPLPFDRRSAPAGNGGRALFRFSRNLADEAGMLFSPLRARIQALRTFDFVDIFAFFC